MYKLDDIFRDESKILTIEILIRKEAGSTLNAYHWSCPLCIDEHVPGDLDLTFVSSFAISHLKTKHHVERAIEIETKYG